MTVVCRLAIDSQSPQIWTNSFNQHALVKYKIKKEKLPTKNPNLRLYSKNVDNSCNNQH